MICLCSLKSNVNGGRSRGIREKVEIRRRRPPSNERMGVHVTGPGLFITVPGVNTRTLVLRESIRLHQILTMYYILHTTYDIGT